MAISNIKLRASTSSVSNLKANVDSSISVKASPLTHEEIDLNFLELADAVQTNAYKNPLAANLNANTFTISNLGNVAVGTSTPAGVLTINHANLTNSAILVRTGLTGNDMYSSLRVKSKRQSSTNMGDNFGSSISFQIEDDGATGELGYLGFKRNGADSTGKFSINTYSAGSASETLTLTAAGVLTVNTVVAGLTGAVTGTVSSLSNHNTGALSEGSNLYFTNARADARADTRIAASSINTLSDVNTSGVATNSILKYNGSAWVVSSDTNSTDISSNTVGQLSDVTITSAAANQVLKWNGSAWINSATPITAGSIGTTELATNIPLTTFTDSGNTFAKSTLATNITGNAKNITGVTTIGSTNATIGTLTVDTQFDVSGPMKSNVAVYGSVPRFQRFISSAVNTDYSALIVEAKSSAASSDNFGPVVDFKLTDSSSTQSLGYVGFIRDGADNSSKFVVKGTNAGSITTQLTIDKTGAVNFNGAYTFPIADGSANQVLKTNGSGVLTFQNEAGGKAEANFSVQTANFNATAGSRYGINTASNTVTATLPASPSTGDAIYFADAGGNYATNKLTIARNGKNIMGLAQDMDVTTNNQSFGVFYNGSEWRTY